MKPSFLYSVILNFVFLFIMIFHDLFHFTVSIKSLLDINDKNNIFAERDLKFVFKQVFEWFQKQESQFWQAVSHPSRTVLTKLIHRKNTTSHSFIIKNSVYHRMTRGLYTSNSLSLVLDFTLTKKCKFYSKDEGK